MTQLNDRTNGRVLGMKTVPQCAPGLRGAVAGGLVGLAALAGLAEARPVLVIEHTGVESLFPSDKDEGLRHALGALPDRAVELARRQGEFDEEAEHGIALLESMLYRPTRIAIVNEPEVPNGGGFGYGAIISIDMGEGRGARDAAQRLGDAIGAILESSQPGIAMTDSEEFAGLREAWLPMVRLSFGPRETPDGWRYDLALGAVDSLDEPFGAHGWSGDAGRGDAAFRMFFDPAGLEQASVMLRGLAAAGNPDGAQQIGMLYGLLTRFNVIGPEAMTYEFQSVPGERASSLHFRVNGAAPLRDMLNQSPEPLDAGMFGAVPADAITAVGGKFDPRFFSAVLDLLEAFEVPARDALADAEVGLGFSVSEQLLPSIGDSFAVYTSVSTGGEGLASSVWMMELNDPNTFAGIHDELLETVNTMLMIESDGQVLVSDWADRGSTFFSLHGDGLPLPVEPSWSIAGNWLVAGASPQAARVAVDQIDGGDASLAAHPLFRGAQIHDDAFFVSFTSPDRTLSGGYPFLTAASAAGDGLFGLLEAEGAAPDTTERRWLLPTYPELADDARPMIVTGRWEGDVLRFDAEMDSSLWVQAAMVLGTTGRLEWLLQGVGAGAQGAQQAAPVWDEQWDDNWEEDWEDSDWDEGDGWEDQGEVQSESRETFDTDDKPDSP